MTAPMNNKFWSLRSKHGRDKIFASPELLWQEACTYFEWCHENPLQEEKVLGSGTILKINRPRAFTLSGLCFYLDCSEDTFRNYGRKQQYQDFFEVISRINQVMYTQKFEGAAVGLFNATIISRDLGLVDKKDITTDGESLNQELMEQYKRLKSFNDGPASED